jgi:hypothetical protein
MHLVRQWIMRVNKTRKPASGPHFPGRPTPPFWDLLNTFWDAERIDRWKKELFGDSETGVDRCYNLVCLSADAHTRWNMGLFALKPLELSDDGRKLSVQLFWQSQYNHEFNDRIDLLTEP